MIFGFFVMGILAYRTYTASMPQPEKVVNGDGDDDLHHGGHHRGSGAVHPAGPDAVRVDRRTRRLPGARLHRRLPASRPRTSSRTQLREQGAADPHAEVVAEFRTNRYDKATGHLDLHRQPGAGLRGHQASLRASSSARTRRRTACVPSVITRPGRGPPADGLLRLDGVGGCGRAARA